MLLINQRVGARARACVCVFYCGVFLCVSHHFISGASSFRSLRDPEACSSEGLFMIPLTHAENSAFCNLPRVAMMIRLIICQLGS